MESEKILVKANSNKSESQTKIIKLTRSKYTNMIYEMIKKNDNISLEKLYELFMNEYKKEFSNDEIYRKRAHFPQISRNVANESIDLLLLTEFIMFQDNTN